MASSQPAPAAPTAQKRSLFKKSVSTSNMVNDDDEDVSAIEFFSRSKTLFPQILEEQGRQRQREKKQSQAHRSQQDVDVASSAISSPSSQERKRKRAPSREESRASSGSTHQSPSPRRASGPIPPRPSSTSAQTRRSPSLASKSTKHDSKISTKSERPRAHVISLDSSDEEDHIQTTATKAAHPTPPSTGRSQGRTRLSLSDDEDVEEIDPELEACMAQAAAHHARAANEQAATTEALDLTGAHVSEAQNPKMDILITSRIPGTHPVRVQRRYRQPLGIVRLEWCRRQVAKEVPDAETFKDTVFLTWKTKKQYDMSTCENMGLTLTSRIMSVDDQDVSASETQVHLEAYTEELFREEVARQQQAKAREASLHGNADSADDKNNDDDEGLANHADGATSEPLHPTASTDKIRLILRSKNFEDYKLRVSRATKLRRIVDGFANANGLVAERQLSLRHDGEALDLDGEVGDVEDLEDLDVLEVGVR